MKSHQLLKALFRHGFLFSRPLVTYCFKTCHDTAWKHYIRFLKYRHEKLYEIALSEIERAIKACSSITFCYFLLSEKLTVLGYMGKHEEGIKLYSHLRGRTRNVSPKLRSIFIGNLLNYCSMYLHNAFECLGRIKPEAHYLEKTSYAFILIGKARYMARTGNVKEAIESYEKALKILQKIPHPPGIITCLNDMAWYKKEKDPEKAKDMAEEALYWNGYFFDVPRFYALDTLFEIQRTTSDPAIVETARLIVIASEGLKDNANDLLKKARRLCLRLNNSLYKNTKSLQRFLKRNTTSIKYLSEMTGIARNRLSDILNGKTQKIRGETLRKIAKALEKSNILSFPAPLLNEWVKLKIEENFSASLREIKTKILEERQILFLATYMALLDRKFLSRKERLKKAYTLLEDIESFADFMAKDHQTMEFVVSMVKAHPFIEGRKEAVKKALERMKRKRLERFALRYIEMKESDRKLLDRFLRNYGRYNGVRFGVRLKGPDVVREFARRYSLKVQPLLVAFWCEEDGRVRRRLERVLKHMVLN
ncbi:MULTISPECIES: tetratricopeptide repeat protein [unclassified Thermotoga]|uniref:tetratricopeptide repeat protein n=1 Tax=unclassified Thermotoga TaxID=2631113 RepID=UPI000280E78D|nr:MULTISPECIES: tetratricopeptide repeat protein [unclassified Thermotoga]AIY87038.1 helix-turn-helix domain protein [Thermotoga sp. 2812B]EJX25754.1 helix-turn-helix domain protein [Thermotoga sp. EMP]